MGTVTRCLSSLSRPSLSVCSALCFPFLFAIAHPRIPRPCSSQFVSHTVGVRKCSVGCSAMQSRVYTSRDHDYDYAYEHDHNHLADLQNSVS